MFYEIIEAGTDHESRHAYFLVYFWRSKSDHDEGQRPHLINDFLMQLRSGGDLEATVRGNIERYWERAQRRGDSGRQAPNRSLTADDPYGVLAAVQTLRGRKLSGDHTQPASLSGPR